MSSPVVQIVSQTEELEIVHEDKDFSFSQTNAEMKIENETTPRKSDQFSVERIDEVDAR
jgi:hypothetical protein